MRVVERLAEVGGRVPEVRGPVEQDDSERIVDEDLQHKLSPDHHDIQVFQRRRKRLGRGPESAAAEDGQEEQRALDPEQLCDELGVPW